MSGWNHTSHGGMRWDGERVYDPSKEVGGYVENLVWGIKVG